MDSQNTAKYQKIQLFLLFPYSVIVLSQDLICHIDFYDAHIIIIHVSSPTDLNRMINLKMMCTCCAVNIVYLCSKHINKVPKYIFPQYKFHIYL